MAPPMPGFIKINFDGSLYDNLAVSGYMIQDWTSTVLKVGSAYYGQTLIIVAEARELRDGVYEAIKAGFNKLTIEGDNLIVIHVLKGTISVPWHISNIIEHVCLWLSQNI